MFLHCASCSPTEHNCFVVARPSARDYRSPVSRDEEPLKSTLPRLVPNTRDCDALLGVSHFTIMETKPLANHPNLQIKLPPFAQQDICKSFDWPRLKPHPRRAAKSLFGQSAG
jgi:hypothetical protein